MAAKETLASLFRERMRVASSCISRHVVVAVADFAGVLRIEDPVAFELSRSYTPYDQVTRQTYPPLLVTAGLNDPRVTYWEPAKWVAKLREFKTDSNELLLKTNMGAGHGGKSGRFESLKETAEEFAFILWQLGVDG